MHAVAKFLQSTFSAQNLGLGDMIDTSRTTAAQQSYPEKRPAGATRAALAGYQPCAALPS
jgi:hypothetical protein